MRHPTPISHLKRLSLISACIAKERSTGKLSAPGEEKGSQSLRTRELCWEKEIPLMIKDGAQRFYHHNNLLVTSQKPQAKLTVGAQIVDFLIDTHATYSVVNRPLTESSQQAVTVIEILEALKANSS